MTIHQHLVDVLCRNAGLDLTAAQAVGRALAAGRREAGKSTLALAEVRRCEPVRPAPVTEQMELRETSRREWLAGLWGRIKGVVRV